MRWVDLAAIDSGRGDCEGFAGLVTSSRIDRLRGRLPRWWVLHSVPIGAGAVVDHVLGGPPGIFTITVKPLPARRVMVEGDTVTVDRRPAEYVVNARADAERAEVLLREVLAEDGQDELAGRLTVRPVLAGRGVRQSDTGCSGGLISATPSTLVASLRSLPEALSRGEVTELFEFARWSNTWGPDGG
jgi:hypothetical protein